jgi:hypothetical protein
MKTTALIVFSLAATYFWLALAVPRLRRIARYRSGIPWSSVTIALNGTLYTAMAMAALGVAPLAMFLLALVCMLGWLGFTAEIDRGRFRTQKGQDHGG